jgi:ribosomal protein S14
MVFQTKREGKKMKCSICGIDTAPTQMRKVGMCKVCERSMKKEKRTC